MNAPTHIVIVLDNIRSTHNVGSIFRTADAFGVERICLCGITPAPPHRGIQKTALGATESVKWSVYPAVVDALMGLKVEGYALVAIEQTPRSQPLGNADIPSSKLALILGNEVAGVSPEVLELAATHLYIPQRGLKKSLNVSVCAGIVLWHFRNG